MRNRYSRGETARLYIDLFVAGVGQTGKAPTIAIQRRADGQWLQASDGTWQSTIINNTMTETDATDLPGRYHFDFDQTLDDLDGSVEYIVKKDNIAGPVALEYEDLVFGSMAGTVAPNLCAVQGSIYGLDARPVAGAVVTATMQPVFKDKLGRGIQGELVARAYTNETGEFNLPLVRGVTCRLEILSIGYDRKVVIPDQASVPFTDL